MSGQVEILGPADLLAAAQAALVTYPHSPETAKDMRHRTREAAEKAQVRQYATNPELAIELRVAIEHLDIKCRADGFSLRITRSDPAGDMPGQLPLPGFSQPLASNRGGRDVTGSG